MGLQMPGAPVVPGCNGAYPEHMMTCLLDNYPEAWQDKFLLTYAQAGFTHVQRSVGHAFWYGRTMDEYVALSKRVQSYGLFCDHWFMGGGEGDGNDNPFKMRDADADYWGPVLTPVIDELVGAGAIDHACVGWQLDQFNAPGNPLISIIAWIGDKLPQNVPLFTHWVNEAMAWWKTGGEVWTDRYQTINVMDRFTWWYAMQPYLSGGNHQGDNQMALTDPKLYQDKLLDTLDYFGGAVGKGHMGQSWRGGRKPFRLNAYEVTEQFRFNGQITDRQGDGATYNLMCTRSDTGAVLGGYGDGGRMPEGVYL